MQLRPKPGGKALAPSPQEAPTYLVQSAGVEKMNNLERHQTLKGMEQFGKIDSATKAAFMVFLECAHAKSAMNQLKTFRMEAALANEHEMQLLNTAYNALSELHRIYDAKLGLGIFK